MMLSGAVSCRDYWYVFGVKESAATIPMLAQTLGDHTRPQWEVTTAYQMARF